MSFSLSFFSLLLTSIPKKLLKYFSILKRFEPSPVSKMLGPTDKLKPEITNCFFNLLIISSNLALITFKTKFLLIFLKFELTK